MLGRTQRVSALRAYLQPGPEALRGYLDRDRARFLDLFVFLEQRQQISEFKRNEEFDALVFAAAYLLSEPLTFLPATWAPSSKYTRFQVTLCGPTSLETYQQVLDWGYALQKDAKIQKRLLEHRVVAPIVAPILALATPLLCQSYEQYKAHQDRQRIEMYTPYVINKESFRQPEDMARLNKDRKKWHFDLWVKTPLSFFIPLAFFVATGLAQAKAVWQRNQKTLGFFIGLGSFLVSLCPPASALVNYWICNKRLLAVEQDIQQRNPSTDLVVALELKEAEYNAHLQFRKDYKKAQKVVPREDRKNPEYRMSDAKKCVIHIAASPEEKHSDPMVRVFMTRGQYKRYNLYKQLQKTSEQPENPRHCFKKTKPKAAILGELFEEITRSKQKREKASDIVLRDYESKLPPLNPQGSP